MHRETLDSALLSAEKSQNNIGALIIIRIRLGGMLYYNGNKEPPKIVLVII